MTEYELALGPDCICGHARQQHEDEGAEPCQECACRAYAALAEGNGA